MKAHIGVDSESGLAHSLKATAANVSDVATAHALLLGFTNLLIAGRYAAA